jgi:hypothetical protein
VKIYLAGPMRGYKDFNHPAFHRAARLLRDLGHAVFSPAEHDNDAGLDTTGMTGDLDEITEAGHSLRSLFGADLAWITGEADALVMMPGWEESAGARAEAAVALVLSLPVWDLAWFLLHGTEAPAIEGAPGERTA